MLCLAPRRGSPWPWASLGCTSDTLGCASGLVDWPFAAHSAPAPAPAATPASAAALFRNRLRPDPLEFMIASHEPEFSSYALTRISSDRISSPTNFILFGKIGNVSTGPGSFPGPIWPDPGPERWRGCRLARMPGRDVRQIPEPID